MELPISMTALVIAYGIVMLGAAIQGSIGFGLGSFGVPLLLLVDPIFVPGPLLCLASMLSIMVYRRERASVEFREVKWGIVGRLMGTTIAAFLLSYIPQELTTPLIAALVLIALIFIVSGFRLPLTMPNLVGIATLSGFMGTVASIGGPPLALLYYEQKGSRIRGTLSGIFFVGTLAALTALALVDRFGLEEIIVAVSLAPAIVVGFLVSKFSARHLDKRFLQMAILTVSGAASLFLIIRHFA